MAAGPQLWGLSIFDVIIILAYVLGVVGIGTYYGKYVKSAKDFFLAGRALPFWAIGMSIVVSDIGASDFVFVGGATYTYGVSAANFDWIGSMPAMVIAAFIFMPITGAPASTRSRSFSAAATTWRSRSFTPRSGVCLW